MYRSFTSAAALLAFLPTTLAVGTARVVSNCDFDVYYASVSQNVGAAMQLLPAGGYSESYTKPNDGISIKISTSPGGPVTQFEFTWDSPNINYDISHINGNPFEAYGESLVPSEVGASGYPTCVALTCPAGTSFCTDAYNQPDDIQTRVCPDSSDLTFTLCPGGSGGNAPSVSSAQGSAAASSAAVVSSVISQPGFSIPAASPSSQPAFSVPGVAASSQPAAFSKTATVSFSQPAFSSPAAVPTAPQASTPAVAATSFQTYTRGGGHHFGTTFGGQGQGQAQTQAQVQPQTQTQVQAQTQSQAQAQVPASTVTNPVQNSQVDATNAPATPTQAAWPTQSWSWGNWGHQHARRAHSHRFRL